MWGVDVRNKMCRVADYYVFCKVITVYETLFLQVQLCFDRLLMKDCFAYKILDGMKMEVTEVINGVIEICLEVIFPKARMNAF